MSYKSYILLTAIGLSTLGRLGAASADAGISDERIQACITSTCGSPRVNLNGSAAFENISNIPSVEARASSKVLEADILKLAGDMYANGVKSAQVLEKALLSNEPINFSPNQKVLFSFARIAQKISGHGSEIFKFNASLGTVEIDTKARDAFFATLKAEEIEATNVVMNKVFFRLFDEAYKSAGTENAVQARLKRLYPQLPLNEALAKDGKYLLEGSAKLVKWLGEDMGKFVNDEYELQVLRQAAQGKDLTSLESATYEQVAQNVNILTSMMEPEIGRALAKYPWNLDQDIQLLRDKNFAKKKMIETQVYNHQQNAWDLASTCQAYLRFSLDGNTSQLRIRKFQPVVAQVKAMAKVVVATMTDESTRKELEQAIDKIEFSYPTTSSERLESIRQVLEVEKMKVLKERQSVRPRIMRSLF